MLKKMIEDILQPFKKQGDRISVTGQVEIVLTDSSGKIKSVSTANMVVNVGKYHIAALLAGEGPVGMGYMAVGLGDGASGALATVAADIILQSEYNRIPATVTRLLGTDANKVKYESTWPPGAASGALTEAGIFNNSGAGQGDMLARVVFDVKNKGAGDSLALTWTITIL